MQRLENSRVIVSNQKNCQSFVMSTGWGCFNRRR